MMMAALFDLLAMAPNDDNVTIDVAHDANYGYYQTWDQVGY